MKSVLISGNHAAVKMKFSIKDFFSKCDQICRKLQIWSHLLKKSLKLVSTIFYQIFIFNQMMDLQKS